MKKRMKKSEENKKTDKLIEELALNLEKQIDKNENPHIEIPIRGSANVSFDETLQRIVLGDKKSKRFLFNVSHARRFMQTLLVASYVKKDLLANDLTATIRDLYYAKKHTIPGTKEDTIDEQNESNLAIVDLEVALETFREMLHLRAEPKGRMAGKIVIEDRVRDKVDSIDLSRMGSGGWAIPSIVEQIEFKKADVDFVLVAEKNAIFDRLNEDKYWEKNNCILITTAGQAARGARRILQRISEELKLPIYCLSIDGNEPIVVVGDDGWINHPRIKDFVESAVSVYGVSNRGYYEKTLTEGNALQVARDGKVSVGMISNAVRHEIFEDLFEVTTNSGYSVRVTSSQSIMVFDSERFEIVPKSVKEIRKGDFAVCPSKVPNNESFSSINLLKEFKNTPQLSEKIYVLVGERFVPLKSAVVDVNQNHVLRFGKSKLRFQSILSVTPELCRLLGYFAAEGSSTNEVQLAFGAHEKNYLEDVQKCVEKCFGLKCNYHLHGTSGTVCFGGLLGKEVFLNVFKCGWHAEGKQVPPMIFNVSNSLKVEFLRGYFRGDGNLKISSKGCKLWASTISRKLASDVIFLVHQIGGWATVNKKPVRGKMRHEAYHVGVSDRKTLKMLSNIVIDLSKDKTVEVQKYLSGESEKLSIYKTLPSVLFKKVQKEFYRVTKRGLSPLINNQKRIAFEKLKPLVSSVNDFESVLLKDKTLEFLSEKDEVKTSEIAQALGLKFITVFKSLSRLEVKGFVKSRKIKGDRIWLKLKNNSINNEAAKKLSVLKNLIDNQVVLLDIKKVEKVKPTTDLVYDIEVFPTHTFVGGLGGIQLKNTDSDPYGWYIYSTMKYGSMALAHESARLGCPKMKFLGMSASDIEHYNLQKASIKAKEVDIKRAMEIKNYSWFKHKRWQEEIDKFLEKKYKAELQALSSKNLQYISNTYIPEKIKNEDFLP
jgi:DNA topoisomerase VI subunit A/intein/homing endonuclease